MLSCLHRSASDLFIEDSSRSRSQPQQYKTFSFFVSSRLPRKSAVQPSTAWYCCSQLKYIQMKKKKHQGSKPCPQKAFAACVHVPPQWETIVKRPRRSWEMEELTVEAALFTFPLPWRCDVTLMPPIPALSLPSERVGACFRKQKELPQTLSSILKSELTLSPWWEKDLIWSTLTQV